MLLLIDLDDTLVDRTSAFGAWANEFATAHGGDVTDALWIVENDRGGYRPRTELAGAIKERFALPEAVPEVLESIMGEHLKKVELYEGVAGLLQEFRTRGAHIIVVTNGVTSRQLIKYRQVGLDQLTDGVVVSEAVGHAKPHPAIFDAALALVERDNDVWMIGDNSIADIKGGNDQGFRTAWISHGREWTEPHSPTISAVTPAEALSAVLESFGTIR